MKVRVTWEFEADVEDYDPKFVDVVGLAKDSAKNELASMIINDEITVDDFEYSVVV